MELVIAKFLFHDKFVKWIMGCVRDRSSQSFAILVNGSPMDWFSSSIGLRQRYSLSRASSS